MEMKTSLQMKLQGIRNRKDDTQWVLPSEDAGVASDLEIPLRSTDCMYLRAPHVPIGFAMHALLDRDAVLAGFQEAIDRFPVMAGRLKRFGSGRPYRIELEGSRGSPITFRARDWSAPESQDTPRATSWNKFFSAPVKDELFETDGAIPPVMAYVTWLPKSEQTILTVTFVHILMDGSAMSHFINTWSHFAGVAAGIAPLPAEAPPLPDLDRSCTFREDLMQEVHANIANEQDGRMSHLQVANFLPTWALVRFTAVRSDFVLDLEKAKACKDRVSEELPEGAWVSTYEVTMAMVLKALHLADYGASAGTKPIVTRAIVNTRGRGNLDSKYYVGNALAYVALRIEPEDHDAPGTSWLARTALQIHDQLRAKMKDKDLLDRVHYVYEDGVMNRNGMRNIATRLAWLKPWLINVVTNDSICNSWLGYNWFGVNFGAEDVTPYRMYVPKSFSQRRMNFIAPRSETEVMLRMHIRKSKLKRFIRALERYELPFVRLDDAAEDAEEVSEEEGGTFIPTARTSFSRLAGLWKGGQEEDSPELTALAASAE